MELEEWEIWYTYSTYLESTVIDLDTAARLLVDSGIALCALHRDGRAYWRSKTGTESGQVSVEISEGGRKGTIEVSPDHKDASYEVFVEQALFEAAHFRFNEMRLYGSDALLPAPYIRIMLGQCNLANTNENLFIRCYPVIKLYESGILTTELRVISPENGVEPRDFIEQYVNLFRTGFDLLEVPPSIAKLGTRAYYYTLRKWSPRARRQLLTLASSHDRAVDELTITEHSGDFSFRLAPLSREEGFIDDLASFTQSLFGVVAFVISEPRDGWRFLLLGPKRLIRVGNYWTGRPHIYVVRFERQADTASENEEIFKSVFGRILARHWTEDAAFGARHLPANSRQFEDYAAYISVSASLWVWSKQGLEQQQQWADVNRAHLIYEPQATMELLEYAYMLHKRLFEQSVGHPTSSAVIQARRELAILENRMNQVSHFMEVQELLRNGWIAMGIRELQAQLKETLQIRQSETVSNEAETAERTRRLLVILFGLLAVPRIAVDVVGPIWDYFDLWRPTDKGLAQLLMIGSATAGVALITLLLLKIVGRKPRN